MRKFITLTAFAILLASLTYPQVKVGTGVKIGTGIKAGTGSALSGAPFVTAQSLGTLRNNFTGCVGFGFTAQSGPVTVTALGRWVVAGNSGSHTVYLIRDSPFTIVASAVVNTSGAPTGAYLYTAITPTVLPAGGESYALISDETNAGDQWYDNDTTITTFSTTVASTVNGGSGNTTVPPTTGNAFTNGASPVTYGPVNLLFTP